MPGIRLSFSFLVAIAYRDYQVVFIAVVIIINIDLK
jgi:hypothetical protein